MPDFVFWELQKYKERILKKPKIPAQFADFVQQLFSEITVLPKFAVNVEIYETAFELCHDIDPKDTPFVALSLKLDIPLWSNDKKLIAGLKEKNFGNIITTEELLSMLDKKPTPQ